MELGKAAESSKKGIYTDDKTKQEEGVGFLVPSVMLVVVEILPCTVEPLIFAFTRLVGSLFVCALNGGLID